jgi:hypothetical protein
VDSLVLTLDPAGRTVNRLGITNITPAPHASPTNRLTVSDQLSSFFNQVANELGHVITVAVWTMEGSISCLALHKALARSGQSAKNVDNTHKLVLVLSAAR